VWCGDVNFELAPKPEPVKVDPVSVKVWAVFYRHGGDQVCHRRPRHPGYIFETKEKAEREADEISKVRDGVVVEGLLSFPKLPPECELEGWENASACDHEDCP
jgi:hypothetical protein